MIQFLREIDYKTPPIISLLAVNAAVAIIAVLMEWSVFNVVFIYWVENLIIGGFNVVKMYFIKDTAQPKNSNDMPKMPEQFLKGFVMVFFMVHFYMFCLGHGIFIRTIFLPVEYNEGGIEFLWFFPFLFENWLPVLILLISHGISFKVNFINKKEYEKLNLHRQMFSPYKRIVLVHVFVMAAGILMIFLNAQSVLLVVIFIAGKTILDLRQHHMEHKKAQKKVKSK